MEAHYNPLQSPKNFTNFMFSPSSATSGSRRESLGILNMEGNEEFQTDITSDTSGRLSELFRLMPVDRNEYRPFRRINSCISSISSIPEDITEDISQFNQGFRLLSKDSDRTCKLFELNSFSLISTSESSQFQLSEPNWQKTFDMVHTPVSIESSDDILEDSVFMEAKHFASKLADGSVYEESNSESDMLDSFHEPKSFVLSFTEDEPRVDTAAVFKEIDKKLPLAAEKSGARASDHSAESAAPAPGHEEALAALSAHLSRRNLSEEERERAQEALATLAAVLRLAEVKSDDSGHSSVQNEHEKGEHKSYSIIDLVSAENTNIGAPSLESSTAFNSSAKSTNTSANRQHLTVASFKTSRNSSLNSTSRSAAGAEPAFKPKKVAPTKKSGPMKATIPIDSMTSGGRGALRTPAAAGAKLKTTPGAPKGKPMAQSTPEAPAAGSARSKIGVRTTPAGARPVARRSSVSEVGGSGSGRTLIRSLSAGKDSPVLAALNRVRREVAEIRNKGLVGGKSDLKDKKKVAGKKQPGKENAGH